MATKGELISEYIRNKIKIVTDRFDVNTTGKNDYQQAIAEGIYEYISIEYEYDVNTTGAIVIATTPPGSLVVTNYPVDGDITILSDSVLFAYLNSLLLSTSTDAVENMTNMFDAILSWLPKVATINEPVENTLLSTVGGSGVITYPNFISSNLANDCVDETSIIKYFDSEGNPNGDPVKTSWDIICKYIYKGIDGNVATFPVLLGTANSFNVINGTTYTGTAIGTVEFK